MDSATTVMRNEQAAAIESTYGVTVKGRHAMRKHPMWGIGDSAYQCNYETGAIRRRGRCSHTNHIVRMAWSFDSGMLEWQEETEPGDPTWWDLTDEDRRDRSDMRQGSVYVHVPILDSEYVPDAKVIHVLDHVAMCVHMARMTDGRRHLWEWLHRTDGVETPALVPGTSESKWLEYAYMKVQQAGNLMDSGISYRLRNEIRRWDWQATYRKEANA